MSMSPIVDPADIINVMQYEQGTMTADNLAARFSVSPSVMRRYIRTLIASGEVYVVTAAHSNHPARLAPASYQKSATPARTSEVVKPFRVNVFSAPLSGYERSLRAAASLSLAGRA